MKGRKLSFFLSPIHMISSHFTLYLDNLHTYWLIIHRNQYYFDWLDGMPIQRTAKNHKSNKPHQTKGIKKQHRTGCHEPHANWLWIVVVVKKRKKRRISKSSQNEANQLNRMRNKLAINNKKETHIIFASCGGSWSCLHPWHGHQIDQEKRECTVHKVCVPRYIMV